MSKNAITREAAREAQGNRLRYVKNSPVYHIARESDDIHHMTVCGRYMVGEAEHKVTVEGEVCDKCLAGFDLRSITDECDEPPASVKKGHFHQVRRNGRLRIE